MSKLHKLTYCKYPELVCRKGFDSFGEVLSKSLDGEIDFNRLPDIMTVRGVTFSPSNTDVTTVGASLLSTRSVGRDAREYDFQIYPNPQTGFSLDVIFESKRHHVGDFSEVTRNDIWNKGDLTPSFLDELKKKKIIPIVGSETPIVFRYLENEVTGITIREEHLHSRETQVIRYNKDGIKQSVITERMARN